MPPAKRRRTTRAVAASTLAHAALLTLALLEHPTLTRPVEQPNGPPEAIIPVLLLPHAPREAGAAASADQVRLHRRGQRPDDETSLPVTPLPVARAPERAPAEALPSPQSLAAAAEAPTATEPAPDLRAALRHGAAGCANAAAVGMTRAERERCDDQLAAGAANAPVLGIALSPRIRAYYDQVALAKTRDPPIVAPNHSRAPIPGDGPPQRPGGDHVPLIGCAIPFGPGHKPKLPQHWLTLGPCFIAPPKGPFTQEVDITPP